MLPWPSQTMNTFRMSLPTKATRIYNPAVVPSPLAQPAKATAAERGKSPEHGTTSPRTQTARFELRRSKQTRGRGETLSSGPMVRSLHVDQSFAASRERKKLTRCETCRTLKDTTPLQRGIIRHLILILDLSSAMLEKDLRPTRYLLTIRYASEFVTEFFEQNPISQLGIIGMRDGLAVRVSEMSGNPADHISRLQTLREQDPKGHASLQNALDMGRAALLCVCPIIPLLFPRV